MKTNREMTADNATANGRTGEAAWSVALVSALLGLATVLGALAGVWSLLFFLSKLGGGVYSFIASGGLLLVTLGNVSVVFIVAFSWLWSFLSRSPSATRA